MSPQAFDLHDVSLQGMQLIEASAGTGKTFNVSALYARALLERGLRVREVLVVTFTKAAAGELRERIRRRLAESLVACETPAAAGELARALVSGAHQRTGLAADMLAARLRLALQEFDQAAIHTIHGFCQRALADAPFVAGVPLESELLADDRELAASVMRDVWRLRVDAQPLAAPLEAALLAAKEGPGELAPLLRRCQAKPLARVLWPAGLAQGRERLASTVPEVQAAWQLAKVSWREERAIILAQVLERAHGFSQTSYRPGAIDLAFAQWDAAVLRDDPLQGLAEWPKLSLLSADRLVPTQQGQRNGVTPPPHPFFAAARDFLAVHAQGQAALRLARAQFLHGMLGQALPELARRKREARVQTYDDLLTGLLAALDGERGKDLAQSLRQRYPLALVDEFQDTDPVQLAILRRVYHGQAASLFLVGDPKQAIYAFRNADLHSYLAARADVAAIHTLDHNQRASAALVAALNALFGRNPRPFLLDGLRYPVVSMGSKPRQDLHGDPEPRAALQVWLLPRDPDGLPVRARDGRALALAACADEIVRLLQEAQRGLALGSRVLAARDIAVLVRSHQDGREMRAALALRGVGSVELSQASVFESLEAEELLRVLMAVVSSADAGRVLAALATSLFGRDAAAIEEVRADDGLLARWMDSFAQAARRWHGQGFAAMFWPLAEQHGMVARLLATAEGARRVTNLRQLAELLQAEASRHAAPEALLAWLRQQVEQPDGDEERQLRLDSDAALVQIVTVHRAKGLEYPVVFCPLLWKGARGGGRDSLGVLEWHDPEGGARIDCRDAQDVEPAELADIELAVDSDQFAEELRLLYVALTRAANRCYLVAGAWRVSGNSAQCTSAARTALSWLVEPQAQALSGWRDRKASGVQLDAQWQDLAAAVADPAVLAVDVLPGQLQRHWRAPAVDPVSLRAAPAPWVPQRTRIGSYSALVQERAPLAGDEHAAEAGARDHDLLALGAAANGSEAGAVPPHDILRFPRGAEAGTCLHALLERVDFRRPASWPALIAQVLGVHANWLGAAATSPAALQWQDMLQAWLGDMAATALPGGLLLADLDPRRCLHELEFHLPVSALEPERLREVLARHGQAVLPLRFDPLQGHLKGFIDLVVEHQGRWYVIDWKSNHLGDRPEDYGPACVQSAVDAHGYALQALIYLLALHRLLHCRLADYRPEHHLGGALCLFVRGVRPGWRDAAGAPCGTWFLPAPLAALRDLAAALAGLDEERTP